MSGSTLPYGPETPAIRRFLVRLAGLGMSDRQAIVDAYAGITSTRAYDAAEAELAQAIERSGRESARDALSGPLLQLVRGRAVPSDGSEDEALDPVAEPALAALLALLVRDLLDARVFDTLYRACEALVPLADVLGRDAR